MNDLISRQAAIDGLKRISFSHWFECGEYLSEDTREIEIISSKKALEVIEALPSAQPTIKPRKGKWIYSREYGTAKIWTCSECGWNDIGEWNFCPNCGADMREVTE